MTKNKVSTSERILGLDDNLELLLEQGVKPENLFDEYKKSLSEDARKAVELEYGEDIVKNQIEEFIEKNQKKIRKQDVGNGIYNAVEFMKLEIPEPEFQVHGLMLDKGITILGGYQSTFKTHTAVYLALCLVNGSKLFGNFSCKKSRVLYVNEEMNAGFFQALLEKMAKGSNLQFTKDLMIMNFKGWKIDKPEDNQNYLNLIKDNDIDLVIFDTFRECFVSAENSADEITKVLTNYIRPIIEKTGCSFLIIMHKGKANPGSENRQNVDLIRGSSMFRNYVDSIILMDRIRKTERVKFTHEKIRGSKEQDEINVIWNFENNNIEPKVLNEDELEKVLIDDCKKELMEFVKDFEEFETGKETKIYNKFIKSQKYSNGTFYSSIKELIEEGKIRQKKRGLYEVIDRRLNDF